MRYLTLVQAVEAFARASQIDISSLNGGDAFQYDMQGKELTAILHAAGNDSAEKRRLSWEALEKRLIAATVFDRLSKEPNGQRHVGWKRDAAFSYDRVGLLALFLREYAVATEARREASIIFEELGQPEDAAFSAVHSSDACSHLFLVGDSRALDRAQMMLPSIEQVPDNAKIHCRDVSRRIAYERIPRNDFVVELGRDIVSGQSYDVTTANSARRRGVKVIKAGWKQYGAMLMAVAVRTYAGNGDHKTALDSCYRAITVLGGPQCQDIRTVFASERSRLFQQDSTRTT